MVLTNIFTSMSFPGSLEAFWLAQGVLLRVRRLDDGQSRSRRASMSEFAGRAEAPRTGRTVSMPAAATMQLR